MPDQGWATAREALQADVRRVTDRLRGLTEGRLTAPVPPFSSRAAAAREAARTLAVAAQGLEARRDGDEPVRRTPPTLSDVALADQVAVTGTRPAGGAGRCPARGRRCGITPYGGRRGGASPRRPTAAPPPDGCSALAAARQVSRSTIIAMP